MLRNSLNLLFLISFTFRAVDLCSQTNSSIGPFSCSDEVFYCNGSAGSSNISINDPTNIAFTYPFNLNAIGYNPNDNYIYGIRKPINHLIRFHSDGSYEDLGNLGINVNAVVGGFASNGLFYIREGNSTNSTVNVIDVNALTISFENSGSYNAKDWAYHPGINAFCGAQSGELHMYTPGGGTTITSLTGLEPGEGSVYGGAFYAADGYLYVCNNITQNLYRIDVATAQAHKVITMGEEPEDATSCEFALPPYPVIYAHNDTLCVHTGANTYNVIANDDAINTTINNASFSVLEPPLFGTVTYNAATGQITYTPNGAPQADVMKYKICGTGTPISCDYAYIHFEVPSPLTFTALGPYCQNSTPDILPSISLEGVNGVWSPNVISTSNVGSSTYEFIAINVDACYAPFSMEVVVIPLEIPQFDVPDTICQSSDSPLLPSTSINGIAGTWSPNVVPTDQAGSFDFVFTPNPSLHPCGQTTTVNIIVVPPINIIEGVQACSESLQFYDFSFDVNGGTGVYTITANPVLPIISNADTFLIENIAVNTALTVLVNSTYGCTQSLTYQPMPCVCPPVPTPQGLSDYVQCPGASSTITVTDPGSGYTVFWTNFMGDTLCQGATCMVQDTGVYFASFVQNINQCSGDTLDIHIDKPTAPQGLNEIHNCQPNLLTYDLTIDIIPGSSPMSNFNAAPYTIIPLGNQKYSIPNIPSGEGATITITDENNCMFDIAVPPYKCICPPIDQPNVDDIKFCAGAIPDPLSIKNITSEVNPIWYNSNYQIIGDTDIFAVSNAGIYYVNFINAINNCPGDTVAVNVVQIPLPLVPAVSDYTLCFDDAFPVIQLPIQNNQIVTWYFAGNTVATSNSFIPNSTGDYSFTIKDNTTGCTSTLGELNIRKLPLISHTIDSIVCSADRKGFSVYLHVNGGAGVFSSLVATQGTVNKITNSTFVISNIPNDVGTQIEITDTSMCTQKVVLPTYNCDCPTIVPPTVQNIKICHDQSTGTLSALNIPNNHEVQWFQNSFGGTPIHTGSEFNAMPGTYYVATTDISTGCQSPRVPVNIIKTSVPYLVCTDTICSNAEIFSITVQLNGIENENYSLSSIYSITNLSNQKYTIQNIANFNPIVVTTQDGNGCISLDTISIPKIASTTADAGQDVTLSCENSLGNLISANVDVAYAWTGPNGFTATTYNPQVQWTGNYILQITDVNGCQDRDTVIVSGGALQFEIVTKNEICTDQDNGAIYIRSLLGDNLSVWVNDILQTKDSILSLAPGTYNILVKNDAGCQKSETIKIDPGLDFSVDAGLDTTIYLGQQYTLQPEISLPNNQIATITWTPSDQLSCNNCLHPIASPVFTASYTIQVTSTTGCTREDDMTILIKRLNDIELPNIINPNGSNNGTFVIAPFPDIKLINDYRIYDRWGNLMFQSKNFTTSDLDKFWDGRHNGNPVVDGVYVYVIDITMINDSHRLYKGDLTVIK